MRQPERFPVALTASFSVMLAVYCTTAAVGYWYFGDSASPLVTADLAHNSWYTSHARLVPVHRLLVRLLGLSVLGTARCWVAGVAALLACAGLPDCASYWQCEGPWCPCVFLHVVCLPWCQWVQAGFVLINALTKYPGVAYCAQLKPLAPAFSNPSVPHNVAL
jgi:hypothetical protein